MSPEFIKLPCTGAHNGISPFNPAMAFTQVEGSSKDHLSPTFNAANDAKRKINMMAGQDSARQYNSSMNQNYYNKANPGQNFPVSPANAFSFSCKSDCSPAPPISRTYSFSKKQAQQNPKDDSKNDQSK